MVPAAHAEDRQKLGDVLEVVCAVDMGEQGERSLPTKGVGLK